VTLTLEERVHRHQRVTQVRVDVHVV
jgi:hypothetical protein